MADWFERRLIEATSPGLSDSQRRLIEKMDVNPDATFRVYEEQGINTGRSQFVDNYLAAQRKKMLKQR
jgi:hypothetical protein